MEIRALTLFVEPTFPPSNAERFFEDSRSAFHVPVQTSRLATNPFPDWWDPSHFPVIQAQEFVQPWQEAGVDFICLGPVQLRHDAGWLNQLPDIIATHDNLFISAEIADNAGQVDIGRCSIVAEIILRLSTMKRDGSVNLRFGALANCQAGIPFFPAAYHGGGPPHFAIAVEAADLAVTGFKELTTSKQQHSLLQAQESLTQLIEKEATALTKTAKELANEHGITFSGIDFTLAPFPTPDKSLGGALESMGLSRLGAPGSIFASAFLADAVGKANFPRCGFSGLMFPVLEDTVVANWAGKGRLSVNDLLSYAAVCGAGLDVLPLPGDTKQETLAGVLLDVAGLSVRLDKPLTARLMPLPTLDAGDPIGIEFPWFVKGRVMPLAGDGVQGLLTQPSRIQMNPYQAAKVYDER
jgi:uncharacterized protein (UPF0210 family)